MRTPILSLIAISLLAGCSADSKSGRDSRTGGTFIFAAPNDPIDVFPAFVGDATGALVADLVFDHLADIGVDLKTYGDKGFSPRLAKSWSWAPDSLSITFSLDPRARWHDGKPVTASDVRYSLKLFTDPKAGSPAAPLLLNIDSVSVKDSLTPVFWFKKHTPEQFYDVAYQLYIVPEHVYGAIPLDSLRMSSAARQPVGSGPFRFVQWQPDVRLELVADTGNYHGRPHFDRVLVIPNAEPAARKTQVLTGEADYMANFPADQLATLDSSPVARTLYVPTLQYMFMGMNRYVPKSNLRPHPIFSDVRVRRALSMSVDRTSMLHNVFGDKGLMAYGPFPMSLAAADSTLRLPHYDTAAAEALLDSAGWRRGANGVRVKFGNPLHFRLLVPTTSVPRTKYAQLLQEQFRLVGVDMEIEAVDPKVFGARIQAGGKAPDFDAYVNSFGTDPSPSGMRQNWGTAGIGPQGQNALLYSNAKFDALVDSMSSSFDTVKAKQYASRAFQQIVDDAPAIWLYDIRGIDAVHRRITPGPLRADGWWKTLDQWSIAPDKQIDRDRIGLNRPPAGR